MLARAAERNPSVFLPAGPRCTITEIVPKLLGIAEYVDNPWGNTKFLLTQFKPSPSPISVMTKAQRKEAQEAVSKSKTIAEIATKLGVDLGQGEEVMRELEATISARAGTDVFEERHEAEATGQAVDEPSCTDGPATVQGREVDLEPA